MTYSTESSGTPSSFTCPECHGALWEETEGSLVRYRCRIGHVYSPQTLAADSTQSVEVVLWTVLRTLEENAALSRQLTDQARDWERDAAATSFNAQAVEMERQAQVIRALLSKQENADPNTV